MIAAATWTVNTSYATTDRAARLQVHVMPSMVFGVNRKIAPQVNGEIAAVSGTRTATKEGMRRVAGMGTKETKETKIQVT